MNNRGTSLLELIIYIAVLSVVALVMVNIFSVSIKSRDLTNARFEVSQNLRFATEKIRQAVFDASSISTSGSCNSNTLNIITGASSSSVFIENNVLKMFENAATSSVTTTNVIATTTGSCLFTVVNNPFPAKQTLQVKIKMVYNSQGRSDLDIGDSTQMTISLR